MTLQNKIYQVAIAAACMIGIGSCSKTLDRIADLNRNENQPSKASSATLLTAAEFGGVMLDQGSYVSSGPSLNADGDGFLGIFAQHFGGNHAQGIQYNMYQLKHTSFQFLFNDAYTNSMWSLKQLIAHAGVKEQAYVGIAKILEAYQIGYLTTLYGDIPWSQALDILQFPHPKYDAQKDIYAAVQDLLTDGIRLVKEGGDVTGDVIYDGDTGKWAALGYLLKARFYNHFSKADPQGSAISALKMVDSAKAAGYDANQDAGDFKLSYAGIDATVIPWFSMYGNGMLVVNQVFLDSLIAQDDPRINAMFSRINGIDGKTDVYGLGKVISGKTGTGAYMAIGPDDWNYFGRRDGAILLATYPELLMIEAEAAFRAGDKARAATAHNAGVAQHINELLSLPASKATDKAKVPAYIAKFAMETEGTITLEKIMTEKHKVMFSLEAESWMDVRRMDYAYPKWLRIPVVDETVANPAPVGTQFIQRLLYPQTELDKNGAQVPATTIFDKLPVLK